MLDAMAVPMPGDPHWAPPLAGGATFLSYAGRDPGRLRIGRYATPAVDGAGRCTRTAWPRTRRRPRR